MVGQKNRYPGAQPFSDDDFSRKVFFGRERASRILADKILANRLVVVYARSGLGKTSLLKAGVAPRLREEGYLPLFVRVNDVQGSFRSVLDAIPTEAERQRIEYVPGLPDSLWSFFKTAEFWRQDLLLTPVLILDQFEELFTLQSEQAREHFLDQLSYLTRGVRPPTAVSPGSEELSDRPPSMRIVLSLREDYLGHLEEAAEHIPQILDARYRLAPLELQAAREAIVGPAGINDLDLETRSFTLDRDALNFILNYLSQRRMKTAAETNRYVEPFQLQLTCRQIERVAADRQKQSTSDRPITMADIGGEAALSETLRNFYSDAIGSYSDRRGRRACRRLCEDYLISPEGRRLSIEQDEIRRQLNLPEEAFDRLVASRLLRSEKRSDSTYYELSHDALVEPILATKRRTSLLMGWLGIGLGVLLILTSISSALLIGAALTLYYEPALLMSAFAGELIAIAFVVVGVLGIFVAAFALLRSGARSVFRYRRAREAGLVGVDPNTRQRSRPVSGLSVLAFGSIVGCLGLWYLVAVALTVFGSLNATISSIATHLALGRYVQLVVSNGIGIDLVALFIASWATLTLGGRMARWGLHRLAGFSGRRKAAATTMLRGTVNVLFGALLLLSGFVLAAIFFYALQCGYLSPGAPPTWIPSRWMTFVTADCNEGYPAGFVEGMFHDVVLVGSSLIVAIPALRRGLTVVRSYFSTPAPAPVPG